eukprot:gene10656-10815_t
MQRRFRDFEIGAKAQEEVLRVLQSVKWAEDVEDHDENAGKRKSKSGYSIMLQ